MKYLALTIFLISSVSFSQVGINTTNPKAMLDVDSNSNGILVPRVELVNTSQALPVVNPAGGGLVNGTLVFNTVTINDVLPGYYYWNTTKWERLSETPEILKFASVTLPSPGGTNDDVDFLLSTTNITVDVFRIVHNGADLTGVAAGSHGRLIHIYNGSGSQDLKLINSGSSGSAEANEFATTGDVILKPGNGVTLVYDGLSINKWVVFRSDN